MQSATQSVTTVGNQDLVAVLGAMDEEVALVAQGLDGVVHDPASRSAGLDVVRGRLPKADGGHVELAATVGGMGTVNIAASAQYLIDAYHPKALIFSGIAGSLNKSLHINDVVLGGTLRYLDSDMRMIAQFAPKTEVFHSDPYLLQLADQALDDMGVTHITGTIATGNYFVDTPEKTAEVKAQTGADAVEMEGAAVCHVAARNGVPALVIRALSDNADTDYEVFKEFDISEYADTAAKLVLSIAARV
ncbi:5'-methylthioadenosine nucleosidase/S-adenosylhomocysteine nucleosidase [Bifidobacterium actinocoloniiforme DSM 22766]|uniref:adenosylhomocysteine nucleosidase n=1 Tax=Bifidobacterium actinocoloniiforme DSM 22766 TaxID=1437605 RepID=A0A086YYK8_9BIFI|nr:5'-methylthioadenosine/S-adenosylhomocysteine nucleosidase [Bifidobacterium actinocoloniiforme]AKV55886.1 5'-methylthioadenosine nucleosidase [Bifidobacterium actinocoloniiforme DSM 22766]KFI39358.1 5'-methylthioadenosine nucleosidase/S-adenosylhomocysteine nucleosidase [Bifidobacterium actinocoloniiforme DSM 22766]